MELPEPHRSLREAGDVTQGNILIISHQERILEISDKIIYLKDGQVDRYDDSEVIMDELGMNERRHRRGCVVAGAEGVTCNG